MEKQHVLICPKCNSTDISTDMSNPALVETGLFNNSFRCNHCGYTGTFFPDVEISKLEPVKELKDIPKRELMDTRYGKNINWWWRRIGPVTLLISIILLFFYNNQIVFYLGLIELLPLSIVITLTSHKNELIQKYKILKIISVIVFIYSFTVGPIILALLFFS
jgi:hypothetical protein